jgi:Tfp pilus assembly protein PilF
MAYYHAMLGEKEKARECSRQALAVNPGNPELLFNLGLASSQMGETAQALDYLKRALAAGYSRPAVRDTPLLDKLRANREFQKLLRLFP